MLKKISNIVNTRECYNFLNKTVPVLLKEKNNLFLHNKKTRISRTIYENI